MSRSKLVGPVAIMGVTVALIAGGTWQVAGGDVGLATATLGELAAGSPTPRPTSRPRSSATSTNQFDPPPLTKMPYFNSQAGYWLQLAGPWRGLGGSFGMDCSSLFCATSIGVTYADASTGIEVYRADPLGDMVTIKGRTLRQVKASWRRSFPDTQFEVARVDGYPAVIASSRTAPGRTVLVARAGRLFLISEGSLFGLRTTDDDLLAGFLAGFHFMPAACWMEPCIGGEWWARPDPVVAFDSEAAGGGWIARGASWSAGPGPGDRSVAGYWRSKCVDNLCQGYVSVAMGTAATGPVVTGELSGGRWTWRRASGATLGEVAESTRELVGASSVERIRVDGVPARRLEAHGRVVVVLIHRERIVAITAFPGFLAHNADQVLSRFLTGFKVVP